MGRTAHIVERHREWAEHIAEAEAELGFWASTPESREALPGDEFMSTVSINKSLNDMIDEGLIRRVAQGIYKTADSKEEN